jgi:hypothetical protein
VPHHTTIVSGLPRMRSKLWASPDRGLWTNDCD